MATVKKYNLAGVSTSVELGKQGSYITGNASAIGFYTSGDALQKIAIAHVNKYPATGSLFGPNVLAKNSIFGNIPSSATAWRILGAPTSDAIPLDIVDLLKKMKNKKSEN